MSDFNRESTLHAQLKQLYAGSSGQLEVPVDSYICDCRTSYGEYIEIQIGNFGPLKYKLQSIAQNHKIKIVHPIICSRYIETYSTDRVLLRKRRSPRKGNYWDVFKALVYGPELVLHKNITLELLFLDILETRREDGNGSWRRNGISLKDKRLLTIHNALPLTYPDDYQSFIPFTMEETFTIRDFFTRCNNMESQNRFISENSFPKSVLDSPSYPIVQKAVYVLHRIKLLERIGKKGNFYLYQRKK